MEAPSSCPVYMHALISMAHHWSQATRETGTAVKVVLFDHTPIKILGPVFCSYASRSCLRRNRLLRALSADRLYQRFPVPAGVPHGTK